MPFTTYLNNIEQEWFLRISPELELKKYIIAGFPKVFEISKDFRNESIDTTHNPEFTMMELYCANADYRDIIDLTQKMIVHIAQTVFGTLQFNYRLDGTTHQLDFTPPWNVVSMKDGLLHFADIDVDGMSDTDLRKEIIGLGVDIPGGYNRGLAIAKIFDRFVQDQLIQPTFIIDYPKETTSLCKIHRDNPDLLERFELFIAGMEVGNAYTELNDPVLQEQLFREAELRRKSGDSEIPPADDYFIEAMKYGMPPTGGLGIGVDRLTMLLTGTNSIKDIIFQPIMRRKEVH